MNLKVSFKCCLHASMVNSNLIPSIIKTENAAVAPIKKKESNLRVTVKIKRKKGSVVK